jgi:hypothetical protein
MQQTLQVSLCCKSLRTCLHCMRHVAETDSHVQQHATQAATNDRCCVSGLNHNVLIFTKTSQPPQCCMPKYHQGFNETSQPRDLQLCCAVYICYTPAPRKHQSLLMTPVGIAQQPSHRDDSRGNCCTCCHDCRSAHAIHPHQHAPAVQGPL